MSATSRLTSSIAKRLFLVRDLCVHHHLEEQIAQLFAQIRLIVCPNRVGHFVGLFEQPGNQRLVRLFAIPRTATRGA